jgi:MFS family permease/quinol monooxygenase YgiN
MKPLQAQTFISEGWLAPLRHKVFRTLWLTWLTASICMWMSDVAAAWTMATLTTSATLIALVQTAASLPVLLLGVPSGALADILNRKHYFVFAQIWLATNATALMLFLVFGMLNPYVLLFLTFTNGIGLAMRWPIFAAIVPELVPRESLSSALALNAIAMNTSRIVGPLTAGAIIATAGSQYVFALNMVLCVITSVVVMRWKYQGYISTLPGERFVGAMRVGMQYAWQSNRMRNIIIRAFLFFFQSTGLIALLPVIAKTHLQGDAHTFTLLLACLGLGAILAGSQLPRIRKYLKLNDLINYGLLILAFTSIGVVVATNVWLASFWMLILGAAWLAIANSLTTAAQMTLPGWVRARGMSIYQMGLMGGSAAGAAVWGKLADIYDVTTSIVLSSIFGLIVLLILRKYRIDKHPLEDFTPVCPIERPQPVSDIDLKAGPVMISIEYHTLKEKADEFKKLMAKARKSRLKQGALSWSLFEDTEHIGRFVEDFFFESWADYLRRFDRFTTEDLNMQEERHRYHIDATPPKITRRIAAAIKD